MTPRAVPSPPTVQSESPPMRFYSFLDRYGIPRSYLAKIMVVSFLGVHVPLIGLILYLLLAAPLGWAELLPIVLVVLVATLLGTGLTMLALFLLLAPVREASKAIRAYLAERALPVLPKTAGDEVGQLLADIQESLTRLDSAIDVAEVRRRTAEAERHSAYALLNDLTDEFRTPLQAIVSFAEILQNDSQGPLGGRDYRSYVRQIYTSGGNLVQLVDRLSDLGQIKTAGMETRPETVVVNDLLRRAVGRSFLQAEEAGVRLSLELPPEPLRALGDPRAIKQCFLHLLAGFIEATPSGGEIRLSLARDGDAVRVSCLGSGGRFSTVDLQVSGERDASARSPGDAGASVTVQGVTIALVDAMVRLNQGRLEVANDAGGRLATLSLPAAA